jgi:molecular chaperone DnaK
VLATDGQKWVTGWDAWNRRGMQPFPIMSIKRKMGSGQKTPLNGRDWAPHEVSGEILKGLMGLATSRFESLVEGHSTAFDAAVITVPAYFDAPQIEDTRRAGEAAGLTVLGLLQEPTAAAMYHAWKHGIEDGLFLVYDLGGGTFDVSVIRSLHGEYQVLGIDGDNFLGGDDFDRRLAEHFRKHLVEQGFSLDLDLQNPEDAARFYVLMRVAQEVKEALSTSDMQYVARRDMFVDHEGNPVTLELEYAKAEFESLIRDLVEETLRCCERAVAKAVERGGIDGSAIEHVLMVGGSTRVPLVRELVSAAFCNGQTRAVELRVDEPDTSVALGAALRAATLGGLHIKSDGLELHLRTSTYTHESSIDIAGSVQAHEAHTVALINQAGDVAAITRLRPNDAQASFEFEDVRLPDHGTYVFSLDVNDASGDSQGAAPVFITRGAPEMTRPTGGALSNPTVLAKDIVLEVVRDGRCDRQVLLPLGTSLPATAEFTFYTADRSGAVILRLYQSRFPIRTIHLSIPSETPVGSSVLLKVSVEESMAMVAEGEVAGQRFWAQIDPPPPREVRDWQDIESLLDETETIAANLWGGELHLFNEVTASLVAGIRETVRTDPDKLQALVARLEDVLDRYRNREKQLTPAWSRFESLLDNVRRAVWRDEGARKLGLKADEWVARLKQVEAAGKDAYDQGNQAGWTRAFNQVQAVWESLIQDEYRFAGAQDPAAYVQEQIANLRAHIDQLRSDVHRFVVSPQLETATLQRAELERLNAEITTRVEAELDKLQRETRPENLKPELDRLFETLVYLRRQFEKLPTLGLVTR